MKQLTQSEIRKNGKVYKNVSSPETSGTMKQVTDIVEKDGTFSVSTDGGKTYSPAGGATPEALPQEASAIKSGKLPIDGWNMFGEGWVQNSLPANRAWRTVTYGDGKFVALAKDAAYGAYSTDGISWGEMTLPASREWWTATYGNGKFVAIAQNSAYGAYSTDGITWTEMTLPASRAWRKVAYGNGKFVAVAGSSDKGAYSTDGINWIEMTLPASRGWYGVTYGNGKFVAVASGINKGAYSTDGITWTDMTLPTSNTSDVTYGDGKFVAVGGNQSYNGAYSTDGITWIETTSYAGKSGSSVTYGDGKFVAISWDIPEATYSTDGIHWNAMTMPMRAYWATITYADGKFVAVAQSSPNGAYWKAANAQVSYTISDTDVTVNSDVLMELTDEGRVKANALANGSIQVIRDRVPTIAIPYTYKVKQTNASGQFAVLNHFVPSIPESPTSLPVTYKKVSGELPTSGWTEVTTPNLIWEGTQSVSAKGAKDIYNSSLSFVPTSEMKSDTEPSHWQYKKSDGTWANVQRIYTTDGTYNGLFLIITPNGAAFSGYEFLDGADYMRIANGSTVSDDFYGVRYVGFTQRTYTISDTFITANTSVKMYLTDEGGVKAQSKANGKITVIRDTVPTTAIPYEYEVEQTSAEGLFEVINAYVPNVPVTSVNGQTGAVTIAVPTKTSELTNDSGFVTNSAIGKGTLTIQKNGANVATFGANQSENATANISVPTKTSDLTNDSGFITAADIPSAGEWQDWTSTSALTEEGLYEIVAEGGINLRYTFFIQYEQGQYNYGACWVSATSTDVSVVAPQCSADGKLSVKKSLASGGTTEPLAFKYRKIN